MSANSIIGAFYGGCGRTRTCGLRINNPLLCQLSYATMPADAICGIRADICYGNPCGIRTRIAAVKGR